MVRQTREQAGRWTDRQDDNQTGGQSSRWIVRQVDRWTERKVDSQTDRQAAHMKDRQNRACDECGRPSNCILTIWSVHLRNMRGAADLYTLYQPIIQGKGGTTLLYDVGVMWTFILNYMNYSTSLCMHNNRFTV